MAGTLSSADIQKLGELKAQGAAGLGAYYNYLGSKGDPYAGLALGVVYGNTSSGAAARAYADNVARILEIKPDGFTSQDYTNLSLKLMQLDYEARVAQFNSGNAEAELNYSTIRDYHGVAFQSLGLPPTAWTPFVPFETTGMSAAQKQNAWEYLLESSDGSVTELLQGLGMGIAVIADVDFGSGTTGNLTTIDVQRALWTEAMFFGPDRNHPSGAIQDWLGTTTAGAELNRLLNSFDGNFVVRIRVGDKLLNFLSGGSGEDSVDGGAGNDILQIDYLSGTSTLGLPILELIDEGAIPTKIEVLPNGVQILHETLPNDTKIVKTATVVGGVITGYTQIEQFESNGIFIQKTYVSNSQGELVDPDIVVVYPEDSFPAGELGAQFGSILTNHYFGENIFEKIVFSTALSTALQNIGEGLKNYGYGLELAGKGTGSAPIDKQFGQAFENADADALMNLKATGIGTIASLLTVELLEHIGLDGLPADVLSSITNTSLNTVLTKTIATGNLEAGVASLSQLDTIALADAMGGVIGGYLASEVRLPTTEAGQIGALVGSALLSTVFGLGGILGSFFGTFIGGLIGDAFGDEDIPRAGGIVKYDATSEKFYTDSVWALDGGSRPTAENLAQATVDALNSILKTIGGTVINPESIDAGSYGHDQGDLAYWINDGAGANVRFSDPKDLISYGVYQALKDVEIAGGDPYMKRAFYASIDALETQTHSETVDEIFGGILTPFVRDITTITNGLDVMLGNFAIAAEYEQYLENHFVINSLIADNPTSAFAVGWLITLAQASQLGLDARRAEDFLGGWDEYLKDKEIDPSSLDFDFVMEERINQGKTKAGGNITIHDTVQATAKDTIMATDQNGRLIIEDNTIKEIDGFGSFNGTNYIKDYVIGIAPYIIGGAGADVVYGGDQGADVLGGAGNDLLVGGKLDDWIKGGDGDDFIAAAGGEGDYLAGEAGDDLIHGDTKSDWIQGGDGNDTIDARDGEDLISGGKGKDSIDGGGGSDIYFYTAGDGDDYLKDSGSNADIDELRMKNVLLSNLTYYLSSSDDDILIKVTTASGTEWITLEEAGSDGAQTIERIVTSSGTITLANILAGAQKAATSGTTKTGTSASETLVGSLFDDTLTGGTGNDRLEGSRGSDTYNFNSGDGNDTISDIGLDTDIDRLVLGTGLTQTAMTVTRGSYADGELILTFGTNGSVTLQNVDLGASSALKEIRFADGTALTIADLKAKHLTGTSGADSITGFKSDDYIKGNDGADTMSGGAGNDFLSGIVGDDTYIYNPGDGQDILWDAWSSLGDKLIFGAGIAPSDIIVHHHDNGSLLLTFKNRDGSLFLNGQFLGSNSIESLQFADGTVWTKADLEAAYLSQQADNRSNLLYGSDIADTIEGAAGADTIQGNDGADSIVGGLDDDFLSGVVGDDTYRYNGGDGYDVIADGWSSGGDKLIFDSSIAPQNVLVHQGGSNHVMLTFSNQAGAINLFNQFAGNNNIDSIQFSNSTIWTSVNLMTAYLQQQAKTTDDVLFGSHLADSMDGSAGADTIIGDEGNDSLVGGLGDDFLSGISGDDTYRYEVGHGYDVIADNWSSGGDKLIFGPNIAPADIIVHHSNNFDVLLTFGNRSGALSLVNQFAGNNNIDTIQFDNATLWSSTNLMTAYLQQQAKATNNALFGSHLNDTVDGLAGADTIEGYAGNDSLTGGLGDDFVSGDSGDDTYSYTAGHGYDVIFDGWSSGGDKLILNGIASGNVVVHRDDEEKSVLLTFNNTAGSIYLPQQLNGNVNIDSFQFSNATLSASQLLALPSVVNKTIMNGTGSAENLVGTAGDEVIYAFAGNDTLTGGKGHDRLEGWSGNDVYKFEIGDGWDIIDEVGSEVDRIEFGDNILTSSISVTSDPNDPYGIIITYGTNHDMITIQNSGEDGIENFVFKDGTNWTLSTLMNKIFLAAADTSDFITGTTAGESIRGGLGDDVIYGNSGNDTLNGGKGYDYFEGGTGNDTYRFEIGDGWDTVGETGSDNDTIVFSAGISTSSISVTNNPNDPYGIVITYGTAHDMITIDDAGETRIENFVFEGEGVTWSLAKLMEKIFLAEAATSDSIAGTAFSEVINAGLGDDVVYGHAGNDTVNGGKGYDRLEAGTGNDTYIFNIGDGWDTIDEAGTDNDTIVFGSGITTSSILVTNDPNYEYGIAITYGTNHDKITIERGGQAGIENFQFQDGTNWTLADLMDKLFLAGAATSDYIAGTAFSESIDGGLGDDILYGQAGHDTLNAGAGSDLLEGGTGNDVFLFKAGDGQDTINEQGTDNDRIIFGAGIYTKDIEVATSGINSLHGIIHIKGTQDSIYLANSEQIEWFEFADGTVWSQADFERLRGIVNTTNPPATAGDDVITGTAVADTMEGAWGDDVLRGGDGSDTYIYKLGDGRDVIYDAGLSSATDRLILQGINASDVSVSVSLADADDIILTIGTNGGSIYLDEQKSIGGIEQIQFADGTTWSSSYLQGFVPGFNATANGDRIMGTAQADDITSGKGNDTIFGSSGADTYRYASGDGSDTIIDEGQDSGEDKLIFSNIASTGVTVSQSGLALVLNVSGQTIRLENQVNSGNEGLEKIQFTDASWTKDALEQVFLSSKKTTGADDITGFDSADTLDGGTGNDTLTGGKGSDTYNFATGGGNDTIIEAGIASDQDKLILASGITTAQVKVAISTDNVSDLILKIGTTDSITLKNALSGSGAGVERVEFADGTVWYSNTLIDKVGAQSSTTSNDTITGTSADELLQGNSGSDSINGAGGNDTITGDANNDTIDGGFGNDLLLGGDGNDSMQGWLGSDTLDGGAGRDTLAGGDGADVFKFSNLTHSVNTSSMFDRIVDFDDNFDVIDLSGLGFTNLITSGTTSATTLRLSFSSSSNRTYVLNDVNDFRFYLDGDWRGKLTNSDFIFTAPPSAYENIYGSVAANSLTGDGDNEKLYGLAGNDTLSGAGGNDYLFAGTGANSLTGGTGSDVFVIEPDTVASTDTITDFTPVDAAEKIDLSAFGSNLALSVRQNGTATQFTIGNKTLVLQNVTASILTAANFINVASITIQPTTGNDTLTGTASAESIDGLAGNDSISGLGGNDTLIGGAGNDALLGGNENDSLVGGAGSNLFTGGAGADRFVIGTDTVAATDTISDFTVAATTELIDLTALGANLALTLKQVGADTQFTVGNRTVVIKNVMANTLTTADFVGVASLAIQGGATTGNDTLTGTAAADTIDGLAGNDSISGAGGNDTLSGSAGNDTLLGGDGNDVLNGGAGSDVFTGGNNDDRFIIATDTAVATQTITDFNAASTVEVIDVSAYGTGQTIMLKQSGTNTLFIEGYKTITLNNITATTLTTADFVGVTNIKIAKAAATTGGDTLFGTTGADTIDGLAGNDSIMGYLGNDSILGSDGNDTLNGGDGNDTLKGGAGADSLIGGNGNDIIVGGNGVDRMTGNAGADIFDFTALLDSPKATPDRITDFSTVDDRIELIGLGFTGIAAGAATGTKLGFTYNATTNETTILGVSDFKLILDGNIALATDDFIFS